ncbi:MAG TPA: hypothetical protein VHL34_15780 [Rhizomicrobium sp.]|jgi:hypothetical protein|nr:hypothetical protein [Rhizomicrobium sp.]
MTLLQYATGRKNSIRFKLTSFTPERITGWAFDDQKPREPLRLNVVVDGHVNEDFFAETFRKDVPKTVHPTRRVGFHTNLPFAYWDGRPHEVTIFHAGSETIVERKTLKTQNCRLEGSDTPVFGRLVENGPRYIGGWVSGSDDNDPQTVEIDIDGQFVLRTQASQRNLYFGNKPIDFRASIPRRFYDDAEHAIDVYVIADGRRVLLGHAERHLDYDDAPQLDGKLLPLTDGVLTGRVMDAKAPSTPLTLILKADSVELEQQITRDLDGQPGHFAFDLNRHENINWLTAELSVVNAASGDPLDFIAPNLVTDTATATATYLDGDRLQIDVASAVRLNRAVAASLFEAEELRTETTFVFRPESAVATIVLDGYASELREPLLRLGDASIEVLTEAEKRIRRRRSSRLGLGEYVNAYDPQVRGLLSALASGTAEDSGDPFYPNCSGAWRFERPATIAGWALDLASPRAPLHLEILADGNVVGETWSDELTTAQDSDTPIGLPIAFRFNLRRDAQLSGEHAISVRISDFGELSLSPDERAVEIEDDPADFEGLKTLSARLGFSAEREVPEGFLNYLTSDELSLVAKYISALAEVPSDLSHKLGDALTALLHSDKFVAQVLRPLQNNDMPAHYQAFGMPNPRQTADFLALMPMTDEARQRVGQQRGWGRLLATFFAECTALLALFDPLNLRDLLLATELTALRDQGDTVKTPLRATIRHGNLVATSLIGEMPKVSFVELYDRAGTPVCRLKPSKEDWSDTSLIVALPPVATRRDAAIAMLQVATSVHPSGWLVEDIVASPVDATMESSDHPVLDATLSLTGRLVSVTVPEDAATDLSLEFRLGSAAVQLQPADEADGLKRYIALLPAPVSGTSVQRHFAHNVSKVETYDLHAAGPSGPFRIESLPDVLWVSNEPTFRSGDCKVEAGVASGWVFSIREAQPVVVRLETYALAEVPAPDSSEPAMQWNAVATAKSDDSSSDAAALFGAEAFSSAFSIEIPLPLLNGASHQLRLLAVSGEEEEVIWSGDFIADVGYSRALLAGTDNAQDVLRALLKFARAGRADLLADYYTNPARMAPHALNEAQHFEALVTLMTRQPEARQSERLAGMFDSLWAHAQSSNVRFLAFMEIARRALLDAQDSNIVSRYPQSPLVEAAVDLIVASGRLGDAADAAQRRLQAAVATKRWSWARKIANTALARHKDHETLGVANARRLAMLGDTDGARDVVRRILTQKPNQRDAELVMAQALSRDGRSLETAHVLTRGRGIAIAANKPMPYEHVQLTAPLDWAHVAEEAALVGSSISHKETVERTKAIFGGNQGIESTTYSVLFAGERDASVDLHSYFVSLGESCSQIAFLEDTMVDDFPVIGEWCFVFKAYDPAVFTLLDLAYRQRRNRELVVKLMRGTTQSAPDDVRFDLIGVLVQADLLRRFGSCELDEFVARAERGLNVKTVLV